jgi:hypothetical protein
MIGTVPDALVTDVRKHTLTHSFRSPMLTSASSGHLTQIGIDRVTPLPENGVVSGANRQVQQPGGCASKQVSE